MLHLTLALFFSVPPLGFPPEDRFETVEEACFTLSTELAPQKHQAQVWSWCKRRSWASARGRRYESRVDGSWIHDRDRPAALNFYMWGWRKGVVDPANCEYDRVDESIKRPAAAKHLANNWPFDNPTLSEYRRKRWLRSPYDMERFGTRGPIDNNIVYARMMLPGCWDPASLDRNDVAATITVMRAVKICVRHGCRNNRDIKRWW